jgi:hypothetical protein
MSAPEPGPSESTSLTGLCGHAWAWIWNDKAAATMPSAIDFTM